MLIIKTVFYSHANITQVTLSTERKRKFHSLFVALDDEKVIKLYVKIYNLYFVQLSFVLLLFIRYFVFMCDFCSSNLTQSNEKRSLAKLKYIRFHRRRYFITFKELTNTNLNYI